MTKIREEWNWFITAAAKLEPKKTVKPRKVLHQQYCPTTTLPCKCYKVCELK